MDNTLNGGQRVKENGKLYPDSRINLIFFCIHVRVFTYYLPHTIVNKGLPLCRGQVRERGAYCDIQKGIHTAMYLVYFSVCLETSHGATMASLLGSHCIHPEPSVIKKM